MQKLLFRPLDNWRVNQRFGENNVCIDNATNSKYALCDGKNPPEGWRSIYGDKGHLGLDLNAGYWTPIMCAQQGTVYDIDENEKSGYDVRIRSEIGGKTIYHIYEHMIKWLPKVGDSIKTGQIIGWVGSTGYSTGPHLHFEVKNADGVSIDPEPLLYDDTASSVRTLVEKIEAAKIQLNRLAELIAERPWNK